MHLHDLITSRRVILGGAITLASGALLPHTLRAQDADAQALLQRAAAAMAALQSFKFEITTVQGTSTVLDNLELAGVVGSVQRPDSFQADLTAKVVVIDITLKVIGIGQRLWVTDPLDDQGRFRELTAGVDPATVAPLTALINPDQIFLTALELIENASIEGEEELDGVGTTVVTGEFDATRLQDLASPVAGEAQALPAELILDRMPMTVWIDETDRVVRIEIEGPLTTSESPDVVRAVDFYDFDIPVEITEPTELAQ